MTHLHTIVTFHSVDQSCLILSCQSFRGVMLTRYQRRKTLSTEDSLLLDLMPREVLVHILKLMDDPNDILKMKFVSKYFSDDIDSYPISLTAMQMRVRSKNKDFKTLIHMDRGWNGILLRAFSEIPELYDHDDILVHRNSPFSSHLIGRFHHGNMKNKTISRLHGILRVPHRKILYKNGYLGKMFVAGQNGVIVRKKKTKKLYKFGKYIRLYRNDILEISPDSGILYKVDYFPKNPLCICGMYYNL